MFYKELYMLLVFTAIIFNTVGAQSLVCPAVRTTSGWLDLFPIPCTRHNDCSVMGARHLCCKGFCTKGVKATAAAITNDQQSSNNVVQSSSSSTTISPTSTASTTTTSTTTTTTRPSTASSVTAAAARPSTDSLLRPFLQLLPIQSTTTAVQKATNAPVKTSSAKAQKLVCPKPGQAPVILFPIPCQKSSQCRATGADQVCCESRCVRGVAPPKPKTPPASHQPLLGVIPRECPSAPLGELLFEVQPCRGDADCWPRVCCPDGDRSYCRTAKARLDLVPIANQIDGPVRALEQYLQCTPPPKYDLFPQRCSSSVDCFPNMCCAEGGKKHCRPPQRSLLALLAGVTSRVGSTIGSLRQNRQGTKNNV